MIAEKPPVREGSYSKPMPTSRVSVPDELVARPQWVCWRWRWSAKDKKWKKPPVAPSTGRSIDWTEPDGWLPFERAVASVEEHGHDGVGFVLTPDDPFSFIDLDDVIDPETGEVEPWALEIVRTFSSYTEVSPSGRGLRIAIRGTVDLPDDKGKAGTKPVEVFVSSGYVTITANVFADGPIVEAEKQLEDLYRKHCKREPVGVTRTTAAPLPDPIDLTDAELLEKATNGEYGREFTALFDHGDTSAFGGDESRADYALMRQLRFWTGGDADRMERLFSMSARGQREKWKRPDYRRRTVNAALHRGGKVYEPERYRPRETSVRDRLRERAAYAVFVHPWAEIGGRADAIATDYFGYKAMLRLAHRANREEIDVSARTYIEETGISDHKTALKSVARLVDLHGLIEKVRDGDHGNAARYRLKRVPKPQHIEIGDESITGNPPCAYEMCGGVLTPWLVGAHLIRNPSPEMPDFDKNGRKIPKGKAPPVRSVGKAAAMVADLIHAAAAVAGRPVPLSFTTRRTGISTANLKRRHVPKLTAAEVGLVVEVDGGYLPPDDATEALKRHLRDSGSIDALNHQRRRHDRERLIREVERLAWRGLAPEQIAAEVGLPVTEVEAILAPPDPAPTEAEMDAQRLARSAAGEIAEIVPESPVWEGEFPDPRDDQQPLGHDREEAPQEPVTVPAAVTKGTAPPDHPDPAESNVVRADTEPCIHSGLGRVYPGGRDCYLCDKSHPYRRREQSVVVSLEEFRRGRERVA